MMSETEAIRIEVWPQQGLVHIFRATDMPCDVDPVGSGIYKIMSFDNEFVGVKILSWKLPSYRDLAKSVPLIRRWLSSADWDRIQSDWDKGTAGRRKVPVTH